MSEQQNVVIDFETIEGPVYTGRPRGTKLRSKYNLDDVDKRDAVVVVRIPDSTYSISSSFFLGLFGESVVNAGNKQAFYAKFHFMANDMFSRVFDGYVMRALEEKHLLSSKRDFT